MAEPSLLKYNSLAIALTLELHLFWRCNFCFPPPRDLDDKDVKEESRNDFLSVAKLPGAAKGPTIDVVLKADAMSCSPT